MGMGQKVQPRRRLASASADMCWWRVQLAAQAILPACSFFCVTSAQRMKEFVAQKLGEGYSGGVMYAAGYRRTPGRVASCMF
jgi:hypothetical protein